MFQRTISGTLVCGLVAVLAACGPRGGGPGPKGASGTVSDEASKEDLQERANKVVRLEGGQIFESVIHYEGGPNESWVVMSHAGRPMQPDLEMKPGAGDRDDKDVPPVAPAAGAWAVPLRVPEWCGAYQGAGMSMTFNNLEEGLFDKMEAGDAIEDLRVVAVAGCDRLKYAPRQRRVQALLQTFVNKWGTGREELSTLLKALAAPVTPGAAGVSYPCGDDPVVKHLLCGPQTEKSPAAQRKRESLLDKLDDADRRGNLDDKARLQLLLSEAVHMRLVASTWPYNRGPFGTFTIEATQGGAEAKSFNLGTTDMVAVVALDVEKMSFADLGRALVEKESDPIVKFMVPRRLTDVEKVVSLQVATVGDDTKAQVKKGMDTWRAAYTAHKDDMDAAFAAIAAPSDVASCERADAAFARLIQGKKPTTLKAAYATALDPAVNVALGAREACHRARGWTSLALWEGKILQKTGTHLGPRRAAVLTFGRGAAPDRLVYLPDEQTVEKVTPGDPNSVVAFKPKEWVEERENCVSTNKLDRITADGEIIYRSNCTPLPSIKHSEPYPPASIDKKAAAALKKGHVVIVVRQKDAPEVVFSAHADEKAFEADTGLKVFMGVPLP